MVKTDTLFLVEWLPYTKWKVTSFTISLDWNSKDRTSSNTSVTKGKLRLLWASYWIEGNQGAEIPNSFFARTFTAKSSPQESLTRVKKCQKEDFPLAKEDWVREYPGKLDIHKAMGPEGCIHECQGSWQTPWLNHSQLSLTGRGDEESCLRTGRNQMSPWSSKMARRRTQGTTSESAPLESLQRQQSTSFWRPSLSTCRTRRWSGAGSMDLLKVSHVWPTWLPFMMEQLPGWMRGEQWILSISVSAGPFTFLLFVATGTKCSTLRRNISTGVPISVTLTTPDCP